MIEHLNARWSIRARLALIGVVFATGALTSTGLLAHGALQRVEHAKAEHEGVRALEEIWRAMQGEDAAGLQEIATRFGVEEEIAEFTQAEPAERQHHGVVAIEAIAQRSQLVANPDPIIFEATQIISGDLPALVDQGDQFHAAMNVADPATRAALLGDAAQRLSDAWTLSKALLTDVARATPQDNTLQQESAALDAAATRLISALRANAPSSQISADLSAFDATLDRAWRTSASALEVKLNDQVSETEREIAIEIGLTLALVVLGGIFAWAISMGLSRRFQALGAAMEAIRTGDKDAVVPYVSDRNETGDIALTLQTLQGLLNAISRSMGVIEFDLDGKIRDANESFLSVVGYRREELIGRHHSLLCPPEFVASRQYKELWSGLAAGQFMADKIERRAKDGRKLILQGAYNPIFGADGKPAKVVKFVFDLTAQEEMREQAEAERRVRAQEQQVVVEGLAQGLLSLASGDLTTSIDNTFAAEYERLRADFNAASSKLRETLSIIAASGETLRTGAGEISGAADDLSRRTEQQAASLEETAAALDQITATVRKTAAGARQADASANQAKADAQKSGDVVAKAVAAMSEIERSSTQINQIIGVIDEIAFQTNLLALNAGVEAARAGEAGRGFAVVASEVRALAQRSAEAAKEIKTLISLSADHVGAGVTLVGEAGDALGGIVTRVNEVSSLVAEIAASAQEQASALVEVNTAINQMDQVTQQNAAMVEQSTAASASLDNEAKSLMDLIGQFNVGGRPSTQRTTPTRAPRAAAAGRVPQAVGWREF